MCECDCTYVTERCDSRALGEAGFPNGMPCVFGAIDGTHVDIVAPHENEHQFVNRHGNHSINAMAVCGADLRFYNVCARWPGSLSDARVLRRSALGAQLENGWKAYPQGFLLGDSGYANSDYLLTPYPNPNFPRKVRFNRIHKKTRRLGLIFPMLDVY